MWVPTSIPGLTAKDKRFQIRDELTVYESALIYAGRHPYPYFFGLKDGRNSKREHMLTLLNLKRPWAELARDIFYELGKRIRQNEIKPTRTAYDRAGNIDLFRTEIKGINVAELAAQRGEEPKYLRRFQTTTTSPRTAREIPREKVTRFIKEKYPDAIPPGITYEHIARELKRTHDLSVSTRTIARALGRK